jgi:hypothetical protein
MVKFNAAATSKAEQIFLQKESFCCCREDLESTPHDCSSIPHKPRL